MKPSDYLHQLDIDYGHARCRAAWSRGEPIGVNPMPKGTGAAEGWDRARREIAIDLMWRFKPCAQ